MSVRRAWVWRMFFWHAFLTQLEYIISSRLSSLMCTKRLRFDWLIWLQLSMWWGAKDSRFISSVGMVNVAYINCAWGKEILVESKIDDVVTNFEHSHVYKFVVALTMRLALNCEFSFHHVVARIGQLWYNITLLGGHFVMKDCKVSCNTTNL